MEYEDQIEKEVIKEALTKGEVQQSQDDSMENDDTFSEFTIQDLSNSEITLIPGRKKNSVKGAGKKQIEIVQLQDGLAESLNKSEAIAENKEKPVPAKKSSLRDPEQVHTGNYVPFLKDEVDSDIEEIGIPEETQQEGKIISFFFLLRSYSNKVQWNNNNGIIKSYTLEYFQ